MGVFCVKRDRRGCLGKCLALTPLIRGLIGFFFSTRVHTHVVNRKENSINESTQIELERNGKRKRIPNHSSMRKLKKRWDRDKDRDLWEKESFFNLHQNRKWNKTKPKRERKKKFQLHFFLVALCVPGIFSVRVVCFCFGKRIDSVQFGIFVGTHTNTAHWKPP